MLEEFKNGQGKTTQIGYFNKNYQKFCGHRGLPGNDHMQFAYRMECLNCHLVYGANGSDAFIRKCPNCQGGAKGIDF